MTNHLHTVGDLKLFVHVGRIAELLIFMACERLDISATLECGFCEHWDRCIYTVTRSFKLIDWRTDPNIRHFIGQRPRSTSKPANTECSKSSGRDSLKLWSTQRVYLPPFIQTMMMAQTGTEVQIFVAPRHPTRKCVVCNEDRGNQEGTDNVRFQTTVTNFSGEEKPFSKNQGVRIADRVLTPMRETSKNNRRDVRIMENKENEIENCQKTPKTFTSCHFQVQTQNVIIWSEICQLLCRYVEQKT